MWMLWLRDYEGPEMIEISDDITYRSVPELLSGRGACIPSAPFELSISPVAVPARPARNLRDQRAPTTRAY